jgi:HJR/Mrr/RecB family endonuclease
VGGIECSLIHLSFFDDRQVDAYLKKRYSVGPLSEFSGKVKYESERLNRFLTQIGSLRSMPWILANLNVFMNAALVDYDANISCSCFDWDAESAYSQIVNRVLIRENIRLGLFNHSDSLVVTDLWKVCIAIASHMALMQRRYVSTGELYNIINHGSAFQDLKPEVVSTLPLLSKNSNGDCSFIHHSLQEFFVRFSDEKNLYYESQDTSVEIVHIVQLISAELLEYLKRHPDELYHLRPRQFEELVGEILSSYGWQVSITPASKDGGYDLFGIMKDVSGVSTSWIIECKKYGPENKVGVEIVRGLWGVKQDLRIANAMLATTSYFTRGVHEFKSSRYDLELRDYDGILKWLSEYKPSSDGKLYLSGNRLVLPNNPK